MQLPADRIEALLDQHPVARLATAGESGRPHLVPIVFARCRGRLWSPLDGKPKSGGELRRITNIRHNPAVCLLLDHYDEDWTRLWWIRIDAEAEVVRPEPGEEIVVEVVAALRQKYTQYQSIPVLRDPPTLIAFRPVRIRSWCADFATD